MRRMDGLSAFMLKQENTGAYMHTLKISILDISEIPGGWELGGYYRESFTEYAELLDSGEDGKAIATRLRVHAKVAGGKSAVYSTTG